MSRTCKRYSREEQLSYLREYYLSGLSKSKFCKTYGLSAICLLNRWLKKYSNEEELLSLQPKTEDSTDMANRSKESYQEEVSQLKRRIKGLEKALAFSKLETEARDLLITRSEEYFNIPIRKKCGAK